MKPPRLPIPGFVEPQLCQLADEPPSGASWIHEVKFDGYRMQLHVYSGVVWLRTRRGFDWTSKFPEIAEAAIDLEDCILDGELCAIDENGQPDFPGLLSALSSGRTRNLVFFAFDCLWAKGSDLRDQPLLKRKKRLEHLVARMPPVIRYVSHLSDGGPPLLKAACRTDLEGVVSKISDAPYRSGKTGSWVKSKCRPGQEVVIGGWTEDKGRFRSLLVGTYEGKQLVYAGKVGTGFSQKTAEKLITRLKTLQASKSPFAPPKPTSSAEVHWAKPDLVAEIEFAGWTGDRQVRQASFKGLRVDKPPRAIARERVS